MIRRLLRTNTIGGKLNLLVASSVLLALLIFALIFFVYIWRSHRDNFKAEQQLRAELVAYTCASAVDFNDEQDAIISLEALGSDQQVRTSALMVEGREFVRKDSDRFARQTLPKITAPTAWFDQSGLHVVSLVPSANPALLYMNVDTKPMLLRIATAGLIFLVGVLVSSLVALLLARRMQRGIRKPFSSLMTAVQEVSEKANYNTRAPVYAEDEIGALTRQFNEMIELIQRRDNDLAANIRNLERAIQEKKTAEMKEALIKEQLERSKRLESIGILAGGVAHDLNNLLGPIVAYPAIIKEDRPDDIELGQDLDEIERAANQATALIRDMLTLARRGNFKQVPVDIVEVVKEYINSPSFKQLKEEHPSVEVKVHLENDLPIIPGSKAHLNQIIMNVVSNGVSAIHSDTGGTVDIRCSGRVLKQPHLGYEEIPEGTYLSFAVEDTGRGMTPEVVKKIFEPFFSTKKMGSNQGSGLGLAICYSVIKDMEGFVDVRSTPGEGTTFEFLFPITRAMVTPRQEVGTSGAVRGKERVLVVDDLREQRHLMLRILSSFGYDVHTAASAEEGLVWLHDNTCDIILLDMMLGDGLNGCEATREILQRFPSMPILLVSGYAPGELIEGALAHGARSFVSKPYRPEDLAQQIRENLGPAPNAQPATPIP